MTFMAHRESRTWHGYRIGRLVAVPDYERRRRAL